MKRNLIIRADATRHIGAGHLMRCIALGQAWHDRGGNVTLISQVDNEGLKQRAMNEGFNLITIEKQHPDPHDLYQTINALKKLNDRLSECENWFVLDGYHFTGDFQRAIRENGCKLLVVDDLAHLEHYYADILLNQNIAVPKLNYSCDSETVRLLGTEYILIRKEFLKYKNWKREIPHEAKNILVTMGGADSRNVTSKVICALRNLNLKHCTVTIIVGPSNRNIRNLEKELRSSPFNFDLLCSVDNMPEIMKRADLAISAGGSTCWELAFMGLPSLILTVAENQFGIAQSINNAGAAINLGWYDNISIRQCARAISKIMPDKDKRLSLSEKGQKLINGNGGKNVVRTMLTGPVKLRKAKENDCELLWRWANDPQVRESAFYTKNISWEEHRTWFYNKQHDADCSQYMLLNCHDVPIGQIRFDIENGIAKIDYSIAKQLRGLGLGRILLQKGIDHLCAKGNTPLIIRGIVKKGNKPSHRSFRNAGFHETSRKLEDLPKSNIEHTIYELNILSKKHQ